MLSYQAFVSIQNFSAILFLCITIHYSVKKQGPTTIIMVGPLFNAFLLFA